MNVHVLIVDDDEAIRDVLRMILEEEGYLITEAPDGVHALEQLHTSAFALIVITDHQMPRLDGAGLLRAVTLNTILTKRHRFIYFTANDHLLLPEVLHDITLLAVPIVWKPFDLDVMVTTVNRIAEEMKMLNP